MVITYSWMNNSMRLRVGYTQDLASAKEIYLACESTIVFLQEKMVELQKLCSDMQTAGGQTKIKTVEVFTVGEEK